MTNLPRIRKRRPHVARKQIASIFLNEFGHTAGQSVRFLQIGGNDGVQDDPIQAFAKKWGWSGLIIEPIPHYFKELSQSYRGFSKVKCAQCAISDEPGELPIYYLKPEYSDRFPIWVKGCASMDRQRMSDILLGQGVPADQIEDHIETYDAPVKTLDTLLKQKKITSFDIFIVDVEGHEEHVLKGFDFNKLKEKPKLCIIEVNDKNSEKSQRVIKHLTDEGYDVYRMNDDLVALRKDAAFIRPQSFLEVMGQLSPLLSFPILSTE